METSYMYITDQHYLSNLMPEIAKCRYMYVITSVIMGGLICIET